MITDNIAIGDHRSSYDSFDVVVNLCYPENKMNHRQILISYFPKTIITVGINDRPDEDMLSLLLKIIPHLERMYNENNNIRILFHCYAGISRSSSVAIAYLMAIYKIRLEKALEIARRRPIVNPNQGFYEGLRKFEQKIFS
jgi:protein-tyrosine phosphatase